MDTSGTIAGYIIGATILVALTFSPLLGNVVMIVLGGLLVIALIMFVWKYPEVLYVGGLVALAVVFYDPYTIYIAKVLAGVAGGIFIINASLIMLWTIVRLTKKVLCK